MSHFVNSNKLRKLLTGNSEVTMYLLLTLIISLFVSVFLSLFVLITMGIDLPSISFLGINVPLLLPCLLAALVSLGYALYAMPRSLCDFLYRYRWIIGFLSIILFVILGVSGSSLSMWRYIIGDNGSSGVVWGVPRSIRSDEYTVTLQYLRSQQFNDWGRYTDIIRGSHTDLSVVYGIASWSLSAIFRPWNYGYLLFGFDRGLSFSWVAFFIVLFLVSFDFANLFFKSSPLSLVFSCLVVFSPINMWWGGTAIILYGEGLVLCLDKFLNADSHKERFVFSLLISWLCGCYLFTMYPAWMVPFFYIFAIMGLIRISIYLSKRVSGDQVPVNVRDIILLAISLMLCALLIANCFISASDSMAATSHTLYPGGRFETGGDFGLNLFSYCEPLFYAISDAGLSNNCEMSRMLCFFPFGLLFSLYIAVRCQKRMIPLIALQLIFVVYSVAGFPDFLARISLLSNVPVRRLVLAIDYLELFLLCGALAELRCILSDRRLDSPSPLKCFIVSAISTVLVFFIPVFASVLIDPGYLRILYIGEWFLVSLSFGFLVFSCCSKISSDIFLKIACVMSFGVAFVPGLCINPVQVGSAAVSDTGLSDSIESVVSEDPDSLWIVDSNWIISNYVMGCGAPTVNSTNLYPAMERWKLLDPDGNSEYIYNRYANISVDLNNELTYFELNYGDAFTLHLKYSDLKTLGVHYLVTSNYIDGDFQEVSFNLIDSADGFHIYRVDWQ